MIRFARLGFVALNVGDLERSGDFYRDVVGLQEIPSKDTRVRYFRCSDKHHDVALHAGSVPGVKRIGFELESKGELAPLRAALDAAGHSHEPIPAEDRFGTSMDGVRTWEPTTGCALDFYVGGAVDQQHAPPFEPSVAQILRLGHVVLRSTHYEATVRYFTEVLNFQVSDTIDGRVTFLRCFPSPYHHSLGIGASKSGDGLHHLAFMVRDMDDIGRSYWRLQREHVPLVNGPGRHLPSGSTFLYYLDPDGMTLEYTLGMEEFPEADPREPRTLAPVASSNDLWASPIDPRKASMGEIEQRQTRAS